MKITQISIRRPVTTFMFFLAIVLLGFVSLGKLSVSLLPDISYPRLSVLTQYPGVAPEEMEHLITVPLEAALSRIPGLRRLESVSKEGISYITLEFSWGTDMDFAMLHTREKLDRAHYNLPEDVERPTLIALDPQSKPILILAVSGERSLLELKEFSEELIKPRLEQLEGIGSAQVAGGLEREIQVEVDPQLLSLYELSIDAIAKRVEAFNRNLQGGTIRKGRFKYALRVVGEFERVSEIGEISLRTAGERGAIRLKDVASIKDSIKQRQGLTRLNGTESIGILVHKASGANTVKATERARLVLAEIKKEYPQIDVLIVYEQARYIENAISSVLKTIIYGAILAFFVLLIFLQDWKTPSIIAVVIPISIMATFNLLYFGHLSLNIMSLGGLALGVGMLVDNSIVVSESIFRHSSMGKSPLEAAHTGAREVGRAVAASTLTTISVFLPVIYVHGVSGQLFRDQALAVTFALLSSLVVSLTLLPMLSSWRIGEVKRRENRVKKEKPKEKKLAQKKPKWLYFFHLYTAVRYLISSVLNGFYFIFNFLSSFIFQLLLVLFYYLSLPFKFVVRGIFKGFDFIYQKFADCYHRFLIIFLDNKGKVIVLSLGFLILTSLLATRIPRELMPKPKICTFELNLRTPVDYSLEQTADVVHSLEKELAKEEAVKTLFSQIGMVSGLGGTNPDISLNSARMFIEVQVPSMLESTIAALRGRLEKFQGLRYSILQEQSTLTEFLVYSRAEVELKIKGEDLTLLKEIALELEEKLRDIGSIADVNMNVGEGKPVFLLRIKREALGRYDISPVTIGDFLVHAVRGKIATQFKVLEKKYDIRIRLEEEARQNIDSLLSRQIFHKGSHVPLRELVHYEIIKGSEEIRRDNQQRIVLLNASLRGTKISQVVPRIQKKIDEISLPPGYSIVISGEQKDMAKSFRSLIFAFCLAVLLVYMIMAAQFESLRHPLLILFTLPMGLTGAIWALFLTSQTLNVISAIGMVVIVGIVVNDAIVKIDYTNQVRKGGMNLREAVIQASRVRLRPILMTTITTAFGLLPMSLGLGRGSELQQPLAISVIGGLVLATFLTLILIPVGYELAERKKSRIKR